MIRIVLSTLLFLISSLALAQQVVGPPTVSCGSYRVAQGEPCNSTPQVRYDALGRPAGYVPAPSGFILGTNQQCQNLLTQLGRAALGGRYNDVRHAEYGGLAGMLIGGVFCPQQQVQRVYDGRREQYRGEYREERRETRREERTTYRPVRCKIDGQIYQVSSEQECDEKADSMSVYQPARCKVDGQVVSARSDEECAERARAASVYQPARLVNKAGKAPGCTVNTGTKKYYFNEVAGKRISKEECEQYLSRTLPLPDEKDMRYVE